MSDLVVTTPDGEIDPVDFKTLAAFKSAVYEYGTGSWIHDIQLKRLYERAHEEAESCP